MNKIILYGLFSFNILCPLFVYSHSEGDIGLSRQELKNGIMLFNERKYAAAIQALEMSLSYEPFNYAAKYRLGLAYLYAGYAHNAIHVWEDLVRLGVANHEVLENLNALYFRLSMGKSYKYQDPYVFREYYDGFIAGGHDVIRASFIIYDKKTDRKFVTSSGKKMVVEMDGSNEIIRKFGPRIFLPSYLKMPMGIILHENTLYVSDYKDNKVVAFDRRNGRVKFSFGKIGEKGIHLSGPMGLTVASDQYLYVVDNGHSNVKKYQLDGTFIYSFGDEYLYRPTDVVCKDNMIYVSDIGKNKTGRVVQFDNDGNFIQEIGADFLREPRGLFLEKNELYISDMTGDLYIYNLDSKVSRSFSSGESKLLAPFSIIKDKDQLLWRTDFNSQKIAVYTPLQGVYGNIDMSVHQILTDKYPYVYALVRIRNKDGSPMIGISSEEISVSEFNSPVLGVLTDGLTVTRENMLIQMVIDRSIYAEQYRPQLEYYVKAFLEKCSGEDKIEVILLDDKVYRSGEMKASVTKIWEFITDHQSTSPRVKVWDEPIYDSISNLLNNLRNKAVVVFTAGSAPSSAFTTYGADVIQTYADQNSIPIYTVNFCDENASFWKKISEGSYGRYYQSKIHVKDILKLYDTIKSAPALEYLIEYYSHNYGKTRGLWVDLTVTLDRFGVSGMTTGGYYVPSALKKGIDLKNSFFKKTIPEKSKK